MENKKKVCKCEICGKDTKGFTLNMCERCFDKGWEEWNKREIRSGAREWKRKIYNKLKKN